MEVEKDFIKREINKLNLLLASLIEKISGLNSNNAVIGIEETDKALKSEFDLTLGEMEEMENSDLLNRMDKLHESHIEKLVELMYEVVKNPDLVYYGENYKKNEFVQKAILLIDLLDKKSKTFSLKRMKTKSLLQQHL